MFKGKSRKHTRYIVTSAVFFALLTITFNIGVTNNPNFSIYDLGLNLASEILGLVFTLLIVDTYVSAKRDFYKEKTRGRNNTAQNTAEETAEPPAGVFEFLRDEGAGAVKSTSTLTDAQTGARYLLIVYENGSSLTPLAEESTQ